MTTALARTGGHDLTLAETMTLAETFVRSGFFKDAGDAAKAVVKIMAGRELGFAPMAAMTGIHVVEGKVTLSANLIAAAIKRSGKYNYRVAEHTGDVCRIVFYENGQEIGDSSFSMKDAAAANVAGKQVWKAYARNMLFARALSNGARWHCPDVFGGPLYTPEELGAEVDGEGDVVDGRALPPPAPKAARVVEAVPASVAALPDAMPADPAPEHWTPLIEAAAQDIRALHALWERIPGETPNDFRRAGALALVVEAFAAEAEHAAAGGLKDAQRRWLSAELAEMGITMADATWPAKSHAITRAAADRASAALDAVEAAAEIEEAA